MGSELHLSGIQTYNDIFIAERHKDIAFAICNWCFQLAALCFQLGHLLARPGIQGYDGLAVALKKENPLCNRLIDTAVAVFTNLDPFYSFQRGNIEHCHAAIFITGIAQVHILDQGYAIGILSVLQFGNDFVGSGIDNRHPLFAAADIKIGRVRIQRQVVPAVAIALHRQC